MGDTPILKPMETGTCTWENTDIKVVGTYYKKDNVVNISLAWTVKSSIASNTGSGWISGDMPDDIKPLTEFLVIGFAYLQGFTIGIRSDGTINLYNRSSSAFAPNNGTLSCVYLIN